MNTHAPQKNNTRREERRKLKGGIFPGRARLSNGRIIEVSPIDVSKHGVGLLIKEEILPEHQLSLVFGSQVVNLVLKWGLLDMTTQKYRYGFEVTDETHDLDQLFRKNGIE